MALSDTTPHVRLSSQEARYALNLLERVQVPCVAPLDELGAIEALLMLSQESRPAQPAVAQTDPNQGITTVPPLPQSGDTNVSAGAAPRKSLIVTLKIPGLKALPLPAPNPSNAASAPSAGTVILIGWKGLATGRGNTSNKPSQEMVRTSQLLTAPWHCAIPSCDTGLPWFQREGPHGIGRKVVSQYFGRNKKETLTIPAEVWAWMCRKHYQRTSYAAKEDPAKKISETVSMVLDQLKRIQIWRPRAKFRVQLNKSMQERMEYMEMCEKKYPNDAAKAKKMFEKSFNPTVKNKNGVEKVDESAEAKFPLELAQEFVEEFEGDGKSYADVQEMLQWIEDQSATEEGGLVVVPPFELLIDAKGENEVGITDPDKNYDLWLAKTEAQAKTNASEKEPTPVKKGTKRQAEDGDDEEEIKSAGSRKRVKRSAENDAGPKKKGTKRQAEDNDEEWFAGPQKRVKRSAPAENDGVAVGPKKRVKRSAPAEDDGVAVGPKKRVKRSAPAGEEQESTGPRKRVKRS